MWLPAILLLSLVSLIIYILARVGFFIQPLVQKSTLGPYLFLYLDYMGPYSNVAPIFGKVSELLKKEHIIAASKEPNYFGFYYDDPKISGRDNCRSSVGVICQEGEVLSTEIGMSEAIAAFEGYSSVKEGRLKVGTFPKSEALVCEFPMFALGPFAILSFMIGTQKCYPLLEESIKSLEQKERGQLRGAFEVYDSAGQSIIYSLPYGKRKDMLPFTKNSYEQSKVSAAALPHTTRYNFRYQATCTRQSYKLQSFGRMHALSFC